MWLVADARLPSEVEMGCTTLMRTYGAFLGPATLDATNETILAHGLLPLNGSATP